MRAATTHQLPSDNVNGVSKEEVVATRIVNEDISLFSNNNTNNNNENNNKDDGDNELMLKSRTRTLPRLGKEETLGASPTRSSAFLVVHGTKKHFSDSDTTALQQQKTNHQSEEARTSKPHFSWIKQTLFQ